MQKRGKKENLVIVHPFPLNSILIQDITSCLDDYFDIIFIDLPGFISTIKPMKKIGYKEFGRYLNERLINIGLSDYILCGISFGFLVVSQITPPKECKAILAVGPYLGAWSLKVSSQKRWIARSLINSILFFRLANIIWTNKSFKTVLLKITNYPEQRLSILLQEVDARTFFITAKVVVTAKPKVSFSNLPYILLLNYDDQTIYSNRILKIFERGAKKLFIIDHKLEHYPKQLNKKYFQARLKSEDIDTALDWLNRVSR